MSYSEAATEIRRKELDEAQDAETSLLSWGGCLAIESALSAGEVAVVVTDPSDINKLALGTVLGVTALVAGKTKQAYERWRDFPATQDLC